MVADLIGSTHRMSQPQPDRVLRFSYIGPQPDLYLICGCNASLLHQSHVETVLMMCVLGRVP